MTRAAFDDVAEDGAVHDADRVDHVRRHVSAVHRAMAKGVDIRGYYVWSFHCTSRRATAVA